VIFEHPSRVKPSRRLSSGVRDEDGANVLVPALLNQSGYLFFFFFALGRACARALPAADFAAGDALLLSTFDAA
jgi:hypothetical protein